MKKITVSDIILAYKKMHIQFSQTCLMLKSQKLDNEAPESF